MHTRSALALSLVPLLAACSFLLDFDRLQGGQQPLPDAGGGTSAEASAGAGNLGGEGGASEGVAP